jgi:ubiquinone/menaquinone biosynthesis C-methylase UbiE
MNESWSHVASWYDSLVGNKGQYFHQHVIFPKLLEMLELSPKMMVLDLACGQGAFSRELAKRGANVIGVDASASLIVKAQDYSRGMVPKVAGVVQSVGGPNRKRFHKERKNVALLHTESPISYLVDDARSLHKLDGKTFDRVVSILAMQNIDPIDPVFSRVSFLLNPKGTFSIVILHPMFRSPRITGWGEDTGRKLQFRRVDRYMSAMKIPIDMHPGKQQRQLTWTYHRPLQTYIESGKKAGLVVTAIEEWVSDKQSEGRNAKQENLARAEIPMFMAIQFSKR